MPEDEEENGGVHVRCTKHEEVTMDNKETIDNTATPVEDNEIIPLKRRKVDVDLSNDEPSVTQPSSDQDGSFSAETRMHSSDDEDVRDINSEDETETTNITNRELEEVMQDVVRKRCGTTLNTTVIDCRL